MIFHPQEDADEKAKKMRPFAYADGEGNFELKTYVDGDGAPPGTYRVSIIAASGGPTAERGAEVLRTAVSNPRAHAASASLQTLRKNIATSTRRASKSRFKRAKTFWNLLHSN